MHERLAILGLVNFPPFTERTLVVFFQICKKQPRFSFFFHTLLLAYYQVGGPRFVKNKSAIRGDGRISTIITCNIATCGLWNNLNGSIRNRIHKDALVISTKLFFNEIFGSGSKDYESSICTNLCLLTLLLSMTCIVYLPIHLTARQFQY